MEKVMGDAVDNLYENVEFLEHIMDKVECRTITIKYSYGELGPKDQYLYAESMNGRLL